MKKRIFIILMVMLLCIAGCGKKPVGSDVSIDQIPTVNPSENVSSSTDAGEVGDGADTGVSSDTQTPEELVTDSLERETALAHYEAFLDNREECVYREQEYYMNDLFIFMKNKLTVEYSIDMTVRYAMYGYIDAGTDGIPELAISVSYVEDEDDSIFGPCVRVFLIRFDGEELTVFGEEESYYRLETDIMNNGYVVSGGSNGAASYDWNRYFYNAEGNKVYLVHENYEFVEKEPYISYFQISDELRPDNYPMFQWETESGLMFPDAALESGMFIVNTVNFNNYEDAIAEGYESGYDNYLKANMFFISDENGDDIEIPEAYLNYYKEMGLNVYNSSEYPGMLEEHIRELGYDGNIIYGGSFIEWTEISVG